MSRFALPILAIFVSATALSPLTMSGQSLAAPSTSNSAVQVAALDLPAVSSSSSSTEFDASAQSSTQTQVVNRPQSGPGTFGGLAVGVKIGIAGIGFDVATPLVRQRLNLRGGASFFSYTPSTITTSDNYNVNGNLKLQNAAIMADFFPFGGWFRLSGGMTIYNNTGLTATLTVPTGQKVTLGGTPYYSSLASPLAGTGAFKFGGNTAGRVSLGTGNMLPATGHWRFESELGVQFISQPTVNLAFTGMGCTNSDGVTGCTPIPTTNVAAEQAKLQNDLNGLRYFPIFSIGLSYKIH
jgi:hypothetical protein